MEKLRRSQDEIKIDRALQIGRTNLIHAVKDLGGTGMVTIEVRVDVLDGTVSKAEVMSMRSKVVVGDRMRMPSQHE